MEAMTDTQESVKVLTALDRCDADCPAGAAVQIHNDKGHELLFCGHHYNKHAKVLESWAYTINDERFIEE